MAESRNGGDVHMSAAIRPASESAATRVLFVTSECAPWVKTGGLGDVAAALPAALRAAGADVRVLMPAYRGVSAQARLGSLLAHTDYGDIREAWLPSGVPVLLLDAPDLFDRPGGPYQDPAGRDWPDNVRRFGALSRVAAMLATEDSPLAFRPQVLHCNDWQTALAPAWLRFLGSTAAAALMTVHNLAFQGLFPASSVAELGLPAASFQPDGLEFYGQLSFLKAGLYYADAITTVSPRYASEIQQQPLGFGLEGLLAARSNVLQGIVNGIDTEVWDPATDPLIAARYDAKHLKNKAGNKIALQERLGLALDAAIPLLGLVGRLTEQKGIDLLIAAAPRLLALPVQIVVLGQGDPVLEAQLRALAGDHKRQMAVQTGFDEGLAHLVEAGADLFLMPSRFEPCGLNQMYSQRYGTPPVAHATGGLSDTISNYVGLATADASGFLFLEPTVDAFVEAISRGLVQYAKPRVWSRIQRSGMRRDFSWNVSAARYLELYHQLRKDARSG